jgi:FlgD Ig-like domain
MRIAILFSLILALAFGQAQDSPTPSPSARPLRTVSLRFALPPLEGTISLGIYDHDGTLVRTLHREDAISEFTAGHDALETVWDGTDDDGNPLPDGKYSGRGYVVGDLKVEGVDYFFNDWVTDENSPHILRVENFTWESKEQLILLVTLAGDKNEIIRCNSSTGGILNDPGLQSKAVDFNQFVSPERLGVRVEKDRLSLLTAQDWQAVAWPNLNKPKEAALGKDGSVWVIDQVGRDFSETELQEFSAKGEFLRKMTFAPGEPQPRIVRAATMSDQIYLLEQNAALQRLRGLTLVAIKKDEAQRPVSDWKVDFEKKIMAHQNFALENGKPVAAGAASPSSPQKILQQLRPDPLQKDKPGKVELAVGIDADGSFLRTVDGLPLRTISDTPNLTRTLLARPNKNTLDVFQDDGAVVEQYRVSNLEQMIAFDCGDFELK